MLYYINTKNEQVTVVADHNNTACLIHERSGERMLQSRTGMISLSWRMQYFTLWIHDSIIYEPQQWCKNVCVIFKLRSSTRCLWLFLFVPFWALLTYRPLCLFILAAMIPDSSLHFYYWLVVGWDLSVLGILGNSDHRAFIKPFWVNLAH